MQRLAWLWAESLFLYCAISKSIGWLAVTLSSVQMAVLHVVLPRAVDASDALLYDHVVSVAGPFCNA